MQQIIQNLRDYKENNKAKIGSMVDKGTRYQKEKIECLKTISENKKQ
jgi:hypothetical protein